MSAAHLETLQSKKAERVLLDHPLSLSTLFIKLSAYMLFSAT